MHLLLEAYYNSEDVFKLHTQLEIDFGEKYTVEEAEEIGDLTIKVFNRYVEKYWEDTKIWEVISVENTFEQDHVTFTPDLIIRYTGTGDLWLVDHKTVTSIPSGFDQALDFQRLMYLGGMLLKGYEIKGFIFNYIKRKLPVEPRMKKSGTPGIAYLKTIDTDYETLKGFLKTQPKWIGETEEVERRLEELVLHNNFFHRAYFPVDKELAIEVFQETSQWVAPDIREAVAEHERAPHVHPAVLFPRSINTAPGSQSCHSCAFMTPCLGRALGISEADALLDYEKKTPKGYLT